ncbi:pyridoxamine 5'-phosphate oxidase family protein [Actinoplanes couchii]|uniref:Oxidoreductase n=1 Tax=Actinoplanes couchii TaxID=403638 RepID=A0ABQ3XRB6_9ACTN|nr:oxidoreductase [Actinoplanes couchii]
MFHPGERALQEQAGVDRAGWGSAGVGTDIPLVAAQFLTQQRLVVIAAADDTGAVWATALSGPPGFTRARDEHTILVNRLPKPPLEGLFDHERDIGMIAIEPARRRRMRINGLAHVDGTNLVVNTNQVYANCPKYIQTRTPHDVDRSSSVDSVVHVDPVSAGGINMSNTLSDAQQRWVNTADTFFVGTRADQLGADASHRGGNPGFTVASASRITWPEYVGNGMFMTLGNLLLNPRSGLLFLDWQTGAALHVTGHAHIDDSPSRSAAVPGAERLVDLTVDRVVQVEGVLPQPWTFGEYFRHNPRVAQPTELARTRQ